MLTREGSTRGPGTPPVVKGLAWFMDGSKEAGDWGWSLWAIFGKKGQYLSMKLSYSFSGKGIRPLGICIRNSNKSKDRDIYYYLL